MNVISQTSIFADWLHGLADAVGKGLILARIEAAKLGNFGDSEPVGEGVSEMRVHFGPGTACTTCAKAMSCTCCFAVATNPRRRATSGVRAK